MECIIQRIPDQKGRISWFTAIMVAMFHSQHSREILLKNINKWDKNDLLSNLLTNFLHQIYNKGFSNNTDLNNVKILKLLNKTNAEIFMITSSIDINGNEYINKYGIDPIIYIGAFYDLLNIDYRIFEFNIFEKKSSLVYSLFNKEYIDHLDRKFTKDRGTHHETRFLSFIMKKNSKFRHQLADNDVADTQKIKPFDPWKGFKRGLLQTFKPEFYKDKKWLKDYERQEYRFSTLRKPSESSESSESSFSTPPIAPPILIVRVLGKTPDGKNETTYNSHLEDADYSENNYLVNQINIIHEPHIDIHKNITSMKEEIRYMDADYVLDSVIIYRDETQGQHTIVGITCNNKKYIYNNLDAINGNSIFYTISSPLIENNWDINKDEEKCVEIAGNEYCYNFGKGNRTLIYVKKDATRQDFTEQSSEAPLLLAIGGISLRKNLKPKNPTKSAKKPPVGKVLNPKTGRYILIKNKDPKKSAKKPPEGKVLNPKTGRYILQKNKAPVDKKAPKKSAKKVV